MPKISLAGFKDPVRRPRYIIWTGVGVLVLAAVMIVALGVTSTYWFCANGCHKVQDDTITAYQASSHNKINCMACHMPVNANPVIFILHKAEALGELYLTITDNFELPLNAESEVSLTMKTKQCTQCHNLDTRSVTPSAGIIIDHKPHAEVNAACPVCHNRVAHVENFDLTLTDPKTGEPNRKHADFMKMTACFRCHGQEEGSAAPGACTACHPASFNLVPASHNTSEFAPATHGEMAKEYKAEATKAKAESLSAEGEGETSEAESAAEREGGTTSEGTAAPVPQVAVAKVLEEEKAAGASDTESVGEKLPKVETIFYCETCHKRTFCTDCHGMEMPHPEAFKEPKSPEDPAGHPAISKQQPAKCVMCHGANEKTHFCDDCHHGSAVKWEFDPASPWTAQQHPQAVAKSGIESCTKCHDKKFCVDCHTSRKVVPGSHKQKYWTKPSTPTVTVYGKTPAQPSAKHALSAEESIESCEICHGDGGPNAPFCAGCHKLQMPHPAEFKTNHVSGRKTKATCENCHTWKELCSNCHHVGSSFTTPWIQVHGGSVNANGAAGCVEKCHKKTDCVTCHTKRKVVPASHKAKNFVRDYKKPAAHTQLYKSDGEVCTYCHAGEVAQLPNSAFCKGCHKLDMSHQIDDGNPQKFPHKDGFAKKQFNKAQCANCHDTAFCDSCHHKGSVANKPWLRYHPNIVKKDGAQPCFECHDPTFCANCHVNLAKKGLLN